MTFGCSDGVHHWDENGLANPSDEPPRIQTIHREEIAFVKSWLKEFDPVKAKASAKEVKAKLAQKIIMTVA